MLDEAYAAEMVFSHLCGIGKQNEFTKAAWTEETENAAVYTVTQMTTDIWQIQSVLLLGWVFKWKKKILSWLWESSLF